MQQLSLGERMDPTVAKDHRCSRKKSHFIGVIGRIVFVGQFIGTAEVTKIADCENVDCVPILQRGDQGQFRHHFRGKFTWIRVIILRDGEWFPGNAQKCQIMECAAFVVDDPRQLRRVGDAPARRRVIRMLPVAVNVGIVARLFSEKSGQTAEADLTVDDQRLYLEFSFQKITHFEIVLPVKFGEKIFFIGELLRGPGGVETNIFLIQRELPVPLRTGKNLQVNNFHRRADCPRIEKQFKFFVSGKIHRLKDDAVLLIFRIAVDLPRNRD